MASGSTPFWAVTDTSKVPTIEGVKLMTPVASSISMPTGAVPSANVGAGTPLPSTSYV